MMKTFTVILFGFAVPLTVAVGAGEVAGLG